MAGLVFQHKPIKHKTPQSLYLSYKGLLLAKMGEIPRDTAKGQMMRAAGEMDTSLQSEEKV